MALLRQYINGVRIHSVNVNASADDLNALKALMEGKIEEWDSKATGGTAIQMPEALNKQRYRVGKKVNSKTWKSCVITIHHLDPAKSDDDVENAVVGNFNANWYVDDNAEYCYNVYNRNED